MEWGQERCENCPPRCENCSSPCKQVTWAFWPYCNSRWTFNQQVPSRTTRGAFYQEELAARGYEVQFDARDYEDSLETRDDIGMVDLETREFFSVLARAYADALDARDFDDELAARDFFCELDARDIIDELEIREPEPELPYDNMGNMIPPRISVRVV